MVIVNDVDHVFKYLPIDSAKRGCNFLAQNQIVIMNKYKLKEYNLH